MNIPPRPALALLPLLLCALFCAVPAPAGEEEGEPPAVRLAAAREMIPDIVVRIGDWTLERDEVWERIRIKVERIVAEETPFSVPLLRYLARPIVTDAIEERILGEAAAADGFLPDPARADGHFETLLADRHGRREIEHFLRENGLSREKYVARLALRTAISDWVKHRFIDPQEISDEELRAGYEARKDSLALPETIQVERILTPRNVRDPDQKQASRELLVRVRQAIAEGVPFSEAADAVLPEREEDIPARYDRQRLAPAALPPTVLEAAAQLEAGEVSEILVLPSAFALLRWQDRLPPRELALPEVADGLRDTLKSDKGRAVFAVFLKELRQEKNVVISPPLEDPVVPWPGHRRP